MPKKNAKSKRGDAERAVEWYCREVLKCVDTTRAVRTQWQRQDLFGCDIMGKLPDGSKVWIQTTAGQASAVTTRRRKLETIWHPSDQVYIFQLVQTEDPAHGRRKLWFFRVHEYCIRIQINPTLRYDREWITKDKAIPIPKEWFKSYKKAHSEQKNTGITRVPG